MSAADLLLELGRLGIRLEADGERLLYFPRSALTPDLLDRLKAHKAELLTMLRPAWEAAPAMPEPKCEAADDHTNPACRCGQVLAQPADWRNVILHHAPHHRQTIRRDCVACGRFICFPVWYGKTTINTTNESKGT